MDLGNTGRRDVEYSGGISDINTEVTVKAVGMDEMALGGNRKGAEQGQRFFVVICLPCAAWNYLKYTLRCSAIFFLLEKFCFQNNQDVHTYLRF